MVSCTADKAAKLKKAEVDLQNSIKGHQEANEKSQEKEDKENEVKKLLPDFKVFFNPLSTGSAGTIIAVRESYLDDYVIDHTILVEGYTHKVLLTPKKVSFRSFAIYNAYIYNGPNDRWGTAVSQLDSLISDPDDVLTYLAGDFNMAHLPQDYTGAPRSVPDKVIEKLEEDDDVQNVYTTMR